MIVIEKVPLLHFSPGSVSEPVDIVIDGGLIKAVGRDAGKNWPEAERHAPGGYISPGLVCSHNHFYSMLARGLNVAIKPSKDFAQQLDHMWWRLDRALDEEIVRASGLSAAAEALFSGVTSVVDHHASPSFIEGSLDVLKEGFDTTGLRGLLCYETTDRNGKAGARAGVAENRRFAKAVDAGRKAGRPVMVEAAVGAHAPFTLEDDTLADLASVCAETGRGLHIHVAEDKFDAVDSRHNHQADIVARLDKAGLLGSKTILAHGLYLTEDEIALMNERDCFLAHNAQSNMNNNVGYNHQLPSYKNVVLGTDGIGSDMMASANWAFFKHRDAGGPLWMDAFLGYMQKGNLLLERYFDGMKFGRIEPGYAADLCFWDYDPPTPLLDANVAGHAAFGMNSRMVRSVMVGGRFAIKDRQAQFDAGSIMARGREQTLRLWKHMEEIK